MKEEPVGVGPLKDWNIVHLINLLQHPIYFAMNMDCHENLTHLQLDCIFYEEFCLLGCKAMSGESHLTFCWNVSPVIMNTVHSLEIFQTQTFQGLDLLLSSGVRKDQLLILTPSNGPK
jgi:hypothetical protein